MCRIGGDLFTFIQFVKRLTFPNGVRWTQNNLSTITRPTPVLPLPRPTAGSRSRAVTGSRQWTAIYRYHNAAGIER